MKREYTYWMAALAAVLTLGSCTADLDQMPVVETTSAAVYESADNYKSVLAKIYASYVLAGQEKGGENKDISSNHGYDFMRCYFNLQEVATEEVAYTWIEGNQAEGIVYMTWDANDPWVSDTYYRAYYTIALCNEFLRHTTPQEVAAFSESERADIALYAAEARFLRAMSYYHVLDLFGMGPLVREEDGVGAYTPAKAEAEELFDFIESELLAVEGQMSAREATEYGRASQAAAWALLARLYLNAEVYTGEPHYTECITWSRKVIDSGFVLEEEYGKLFNADNHLRTNEIIFSFVVDSEHSVSWGATTYIVCGQVGNSSTQVAADYGVSSGWGMFRVRGEFVEKFEEGDVRGAFYTDGQSQWLDGAIDDQTKGYFGEKFSNLTDDGVAASNTASDGVDTDMPVFRLADVYLMLAESVIRGGSGATRQEALGYLNALRQRAFGDSNHNIADEQMTLDYIIDERARELYWECTRRTDLIRFGLYTSGDYLWQWKGGVQDGRKVDDKYNLFPIPATETAANPNIKNENY